MKLDVETVKAIRNRTPLPDKKQDALVALIRELVSERGFVPEGVKDRFLKAGYTEVALMDVLVGVALGTMSNYFDHLNPIAIDQAFQAEAY
jgi:alkylhydroperoxidase family enzyme